jgi:Zn-finger nucleic acid-binding protein
VRRCTVLRKKATPPEPPPPPVCPECTGPFEEHHKYGSIFLKCKVCEGTWFARGELQKYVKWFMQNPSAVAKPVLLFPRKVDAANRREDSTLKCIHCKHDLEFFNYAYDSNIMLKRCEECGGVWIDKKQLAGVVSYSNFRVWEPQTKGKRSRF